MHFLCSELEKMKWLNEWCYIRNEKLYGVWDSLKMLPDHYLFIDDVLQKMKELVDNEH